MNFTFDPKRCWNKHFPIESIGVEILFFHSEQVNQYHQQSYPVCHLFFTEYVQGKPQLSSIRRVNRKPAQSSRPGHSFDVHDGMCAANVQLIRVNYIKETTPQRPPRPSRRNSS
jgi:hypothetical protein